MTTDRLYVRAERHSALLTYARERVVAGQTITAQRLYRPRDLARVRFDVLRAIEAELWHDLNRYAERHPC